MLSDYSKYEYVIDNWKLRYLVCLECLALRVLQVLAIVKVVLVDVHSPLQAVQDSWK